MVRTSCKADQNRFPGWEKRLFLYIGLWCKRKAWRSPKPQISVQVRTDLLMGCWYNGDYNGLLIRQIRDEIPGDPLTPHRSNGSGRHILNVEIRVRLPLG